jgi:hypothetical protein
MPTDEHCRGREPDRPPPAGFELLDNDHSGGRRRPVPPRLLVLGLLCTQSALFLAFAVHQLGTGAYLGVHLGVCATAAAIGLFCACPSPTIEDAGDRTAILIQLLIWTLLAGPFGAAVAAMLLVPSSSRAGRTEDETESVLGNDAGFQPARLELVHGSLLDRRLRIEHAHRIRPLVDVILDGTQLEKFDALGLISKRFSPAVAPTLRRALEDKDGSVRVLAATVLAKQHDGHTNRIGALQAQAQAASACSEDWRELGQARLDYAGSGLLETSRADIELRHARADFARAE